MSDIDDGVAVVGMACRLPQASTPEALWRLLRNGESGITSAPPDRWGTGRPGTGKRSSALRGGVLDDVDRFDPGFFGISPREAAAMDPQQRLFLELGWEVLEDAGVVPGSVRDTALGVFVGAMWDDYAHLAYSDDTLTSQHTMTGIHRSAIANRLSYVLGSHGPSMVVDSGQSSSLVAVHLATESLLRGESSLAIAGGVNLALLHQSSAISARWGAISPDGECHTFDARANGYVRGEGGGAVLLKPFRQAVADGDRIYCVVHGSAMNSGSAGTLTTPSVEAQGAVLRAAYRRAGVDPAGVQYVELHGTGTRVGDPVEAAALGAVFGPGRGETPLAVGSVKTNVGHLESAAGIAGLIKVALCLHHRAWVPSLNFEAPPSDIPLDRLKLAVQRELRTWDPQGGQVLAGVSSFGMVGANCHVVLGSHPSAHDPERAARRVSPVLPWVLSGHTPAALRAQAVALSGHLDAPPDDVAWSLAHSRTAFRHRAVVLGATLPDLRFGLDAVAGQRSHPSVMTGEAGSGGLAFLFTGQGAQHPRMGAQLYEVFPQYAEALDEVCAHFDRWLDRPLRDMILSGDDLDPTGWAQPALFATEVALFRLVRSWGVRPDAVAGHSLGELTAAHVAGVLSLPDAVRLVAARGTLMQALPPGGAMTALEATESEVTALLADEAEVSIAAVNGPSSLVISGAEAAVGRVAEQVRAAGGRIKRLPVSHAFHSPLIEPMLADFAAVADEIDFRDPEIPLVSGVTGQVATEREWGSPDYWVRHARLAVRFRDVVHTLRDFGVRTALELGPDAALTPMIAESSGELAAVASLRVGKPEAVALMTAVARLFCRGVDVHWDGLFDRPRRADLPTYAFQREGYWLDGARVSQPEQRTESDRDLFAPHKRSEDAPRTVRTVRELSDAVGAQVATALGYADPALVDRNVPFADLGLDSMTGVELRDALSALTGLALPTGLLFDHPTVERLAAHLQQVLSPSPDDTGNDPVRERQDSEPIAIIGMGCRFPGGINSPEDLWSLVIEETDAITPFPDDRGWDLETLYHPDPQHPGTSYVRHGGFLDDAAGFDAGFFSISPREALAMDPQQRLLLETAWQAVETARVAPATLRGTETGVFIGGTDMEYGSSLYDAPEHVGGQLLTGTSASVMSGRIAYQLGLHGPALTVDTACSSSLVALHLAARALHAGECDLALAGGATVMSSPGMFLEFSRQGGLAPDGRCKAFSADADGTVWSEGVGMLLVERLSDARRHGHPVLAVLRGSAVNQDGASNGLTAPSGAAQQRLIRRALADARLAPSEVDAVEAHGTGTTLGDPIEAEALLAVYGQGRPEDRPLLVGTLKSNLGHAQAAAGVAGVIKMVMALRHGTLPRTLHITEPTPRVQWAQGNAELLTRTRPWPENDRARRAAVSSFGISGTNAHVIVEQAPETPLAASVTRDDRYVAWVLSGTDAAALRTQALRLHSDLSHRDDWQPEDIALSLATTRTALSHRASVTGARREQLLQGLRALAEDTGDGKRTGTGKLVVLFTGQGSQRVAMGRELAREFPYFAQEFQKVRDLFDQPVRHVIDGDDEAALNRTEFTQPAVFALEVALFRLLQSWGVQPDYLAGHSIGEIAAAHVAGVFSLSDAATLVTARGRLMQELPAGGAMVALQASEAEVEPFLTSGVGIAAVNSPTSVVISGAEDEVTSLVSRFPGRRSKRLHVSHAFHSPLMDPVLERFREVVAGLRFGEPRLPIVSMLTGSVATADELRSPEYWVRHARGTVRFSDAIATLTGLGVTTFLEAGPDAALTPMVVEANAGSTDVSAVPLLRADRREDATAVAAIAQLFCRGHDVDLAAPTGDARVVDLPPYSFRRQRFWLALTEGAATGEQPEPAQEAGQETAPEAAEGRSPQLRALVGDASGVELHRLLLNVVRGAVATVLGYDTPGALDPATSFIDLGLTSLTAVELHAKLQAATGVPLPVTIAYDAPTALAVVDRLTSLEAPTTEAAPAETKGEPDEPIAVIGMACRYPGGVSSPEQLWQLVAEGTDAIAPFPDNRGWDMEALFDADPSSSGKTYTRQGGFLHDAGGFDAGFFGISPREALAMEPQQRLLLETAWETFERAGIPVDSVRGTATGVFLGASAQAYGPLMHDAPRHVEGHMLTGGHPSIMSGRISYQLGLTGPALTVDTACSSSLVALHLAARSLRAGECTLALVGGANVMSLPGALLEFSRQGGLAPDGRCKAFSADADGTDFAEGVGVLLVERLSDARRHGHQVLAVLRGSAVNQDGASNGLTAPNGQAQQRMIRSALADARLGFPDIDVVEAHGTGTRLGDPIEAEALLATYGADRPGEPLYLGSIKSNIGHTQHAAGVAGVIKMVMAMRHGVLPKTLHAEEPSPHVNWSAGKVELLTSARSWPETQRPRRAGISAFGFSGTNAHVIMEQGDAARTDQGTDRPPSPAVIPWVVTARSESALREQASRLLDAVAAGDDDLADIGASLLERRSILDHRAVVLGQDRDSLLEGLMALRSATPHPGVVTGRASVGDDGVVFVFPGQGSQWSGMATALLETSEVFAESMARCEAELSEFADWSLLDVLHEVSGAPSLKRLDVVQPVLFAVHVSLAAVWRSMGVEPAAVVGHSQGEIAAACVAGAISLRDGMRIVALRSRLMGELSGKGAMLSVPMPAGQLKELLPQWGERLSVAAVTGPQVTVVSGEPDAIEELFAKLGNLGVKARRIAGADVAGHSAQVEVLRERLLEILAPVAPRTPTVPFYSTVTGELLDTTVLDADYWYRNMREPVLFQPALEALARRHHRVFLEVSAHPVLTMGVQETVEQTGGEVMATGSLRRDHGGLDQFLSSVATLFVNGVTVDWSALLRGAATVELPTYAFQHEWFWLTAAAGTGDRAGAVSTGARHPLDAAVDLADGRGALLTGRMSAASQPWLIGEVRGERAVVPGAFITDWVVQAGDHVGLRKVDSLMIGAPLLMPETGAISVQVSAGPADEFGRREVTVHSRPDDGGDLPWTRHAVAILSEHPARAESLTEWPPSGAVDMDVEQLYRDLEAAGHRFEPAARGIRRLWRAREELFAEVALRDDSVAGDVTGFPLHPLLLDAATHPLLDEERAAVVSWSGLSVLSEGARTVRVRLTPGPDGAALLLADASGAPVAVAEKVCVGPVAQDAPRVTDAGVRESLYNLDWKRIPVDLHVTMDHGWSTLLPPELPHAATWPLTGHPDLGSLAAGGIPEVILLPLTGTAGLDVPAETHDLVQSVLALLQAWLADERFEHTRLVIVTSGAGPTVRDSRQVALGAVWGLVRTAQSENPNRFVLVDLDDVTRAQAVLPQLLATGESQIALRGDAALVPRLAREHAETDPAVTWDGSGTVLITGGTGGLGALAARHLVDEHGVRDLLLVSRRGPESPGADRLRSDLERRGARVRVARCDVTDRAQLASLLATVPDTAPLSAVVHTAGVLADGILNSLTPDQVAAVLRPKVDAAWALHDLTSDLDLSAFVVYSSVAGVLGNAGQGNYAAANAFMDALATYRYTAGLPATSLAWGLWGTESGMGSHLSAADFRRIADTGVKPLDAELGMRLFDTAVASGQALHVPAVFDLETLRNDGDTPSPVLRGLVGAGPRRQASDGNEEAGLVEKLAGLPADEQERVLLSFVQHHVADVLGLATPASVKASGPLRDLGFDSLTAVTLRNRLKASTALTLPVTLVFDHPTPSSLARFLHRELVPDSAPRAAVVEGQAAGLMDAVAAEGTPQTASLDDLDGASLLRLAARQSSARSGGDK
ncbi:type I polyketide synthase [Streptomyces xiamenensis]|nr:type I polyketide synthase [Streptomyces xiamenensis]